jgi:hypothetical protein
MVRVELELMRAGCKLENESFVSRPQAANDDEATNGQKQ